MTLRRAGFGDLATQMLNELPETASIDEVYRWAEDHGVNRELLIERMGGSP